MGCIFAYQQETNVNVKKLSSTMLSKVHSMSYFYLTKIKCNLYGESYKTVENLNKCQKIVINRKMQSHKSYQFFAKI